MMNSDDRKLLKKEIEKYINWKNYKNDKVSSMTISPICAVESEFYDRKKGMRLLIKNEYGLLGNLMFKYVSSGDEEIAELIDRLDTKLVRDAYRKFGSKFLTAGNGRTRFSLTILLNDHPELVTFVPDNIGDTDLAMDVAERCPRIMEKMNPSLKRDLEFVERMLDINPACLEWVDWKFRSDEELATKAVLANPEMIRCADISIRRNRDLFLHAVKHNGMLLFYADEDFRDDVEMVKAAVLSNKLALRYASERIQKMFEERDKRRGRIDNYTKCNEDK